MPTPATLAYLAIVFPDKASPLPALAAGVIRALTDCCGQAPTLVHPDQNKLVMLVSGESAAIVKALQAACQQHNDSWLLTQVGTPCAANGLSKADGWIRSHSLASRK